MMGIPDTATMPITSAEPADVPAIGAVLARAFQDDPVFAWVVPDPDRRRASLPSVFAAFADAYLPHGETYVAGDGAGAAMWAPAGVDPLAGQPGETFGERMTAILGDDAPRAFEISALQEQHHPAEHCYYLQFIGVLPERHGRGLGGRLLDTVLRHCDATATPAYLEATSLHNRRLYQRHDFATLEELTLPDGPPLWPMWREPAP